MSNFDDLDDVIGPLRSSATPAELAGETEMVSLMAHAHRTAKGNTMFTSRRARVATLIAAGVIGFGGVAAAGPGGFSLLGNDDGGITTEDVTTTTEQPGEDVTEDIEDVTTTTESEDVTTTTDGVEEIDAAIEKSLAIEEAPLVDDLDTDFNEEYCEPGNHGKTVSKAAHGGWMVPNPDPEAEEELVEVSVVDAAHSMCGKMDATVATEEPDVDETEVDAVEETEQTEQSTKQHGKPESPGNSAKGSNGNGNGKGKSGK